MPRPRKKDTAALSTLSTRIRRRADFTLVWVQGDRVEDAALNSTEAQRILDHQQDLVAGVFDGDARVADLRHALSAFQPLVGEPAGG